ncbi:hypothetical protein O8C76_10370 [Aliarcobacter butzleri]|uniref:DUF4760 domain-containing protein n=1 Tax=Aliarcobacter butzleri TaxID=28197 RepID=A0AAW7PZI7_9BACT|nr:hypothetical protein [Aliarcobacter butzleri]MDN5071424.1 hypothetical protein [Aliarcobacter butzleri]
MIDYIETIFGFIILIAIWVAYNYSKSKYEEEQKEDLHYENIAKKTTNEILYYYKERIFELEQVLFLVTDILHDEQKRKLFIEDEISYILTNARLFTRYGRISIEALQQDNPTLVKRDKEFIEYLKNNVWTKMYGKSFDECFKDK